MYILVALNAPSNLLVTHIHLAESKFAPRLGTYRQSFSFIDLPSFNLISASPIYLENNHPPPTLMTQCGIGLKGPWKFLKLSVMLDEAAVSGIHSSGETLLASS